MSISVFLYAAISEWGAHMCLAFWSHWNMSADAWNLESTFRGHSTRRAVKFVSGTFERELERAREKDIWLSRQIQFVSMIMFTGIISLCLRTWLLARARDKVVCALCVSLWHGVNSILDEITAKLSRELLFIFFSMPRVLHVFNPSDLKNSFNS